MTACGAKTREHARRAITAQTDAEQAGRRRSRGSKRPKPRLRRRLARNFSKNHARKCGIRTVEYIEELDVESHLHTLGQRKPLREVEVTPRKMGTPQRIAAKVPELTVLRTVATKARAGTRVHGRDKGIGIKPLTRWTCESMSPGMRKPPSPETTVAPAGGLALAFLSTRTIRSFSISTLPLARSWRAKTDSIHPGRNGTHMMFPSLSRYLPVGLLLLRLIVGIVFIDSGWNAHLQRAGLGEGDIQAAAIILASFKQQFMTLIDQYNSSSRSLTQHKRWSTSVPRETRRLGAEYP